MLDNPTFDGLLNKLDIVFELIECSSTDYLTDGSGTEVHADSSSVAIIKVGNLDSSWSGQVSHTTSARRRNLATSDVCGIMFNAVPTNLASKSNLVMKIQYDQTCSTQKTMCDSNYSQTANPKCCQLTVQSKTTDYSGAISMKTESVTSDQNGEAKLQMPSPGTCNADTKCMYYDETNKCWTLDNVSIAADCSACMTPHLSIFSMASPSKIITGGGSNSGGSSSGGNNNSSNGGSPAQVITEAAETEAIALYENLMLYIIIFLDILLVYLFCRTWRSRNIKVYAISTENKVQVKGGYTKTAHAPVDDNKMFKSNRRAEENKHQTNIDKVYGLEEAKAGTVQLELQKQDQSFDQMNQDVNSNIHRARESVVKNPVGDLNAQENTLKRSYCHSYWTTVIKKNRLISPICYSHPKMSNFSRGLSLVISFNIAFMILASSLLVLESIGVMIAPILLCFILMRVLAVPLESMLLKRHMKMLNRVQFGLLALLIVIEGIVLFIASLIESDRYEALNLSVLGFLIIEVVIYEMFIHIFHVWLTRKLIRNPSIANKFRLSTKYFLNELVQDAINDAQ